LHHDVESTDIDALFEKKLPDIKILSVRLIKNLDSGEKRGIAFVDVDTQENAERALKLNGLRIKD
jgi:RNA recognition motif-containing protein